MAAQTHKTILVERPGPMTDLERGQFLAGLQQSAKTSDLIKANKVMQDTITNMETTFGLIEPATTLVAQDEAKLKVDKDAVFKARSDFDKLTNLFIDLVEHDATSANDVTSTNLKPRPKQSASSLKGQVDLPVPERVDIVPPTKGKGPVKATVYETGKTRRKYAAQVSIDPYGPTTWSNLAGYGKSRKLTGPSGSKLWIRFALVSGQRQGEWSTPVLVTFP